MIVVLRIILLDLVPPRNMSVQRGLTFIPITGWKRHGDGLGGNEKRAKSAVDEAAVTKIKTLAGELLARIDAADVSGLDNPSKWSTLPFPCISDSPVDRFAFNDVGDFCFMGRVSLPTIHAEIERMSKTKRVNIYGTKGYGKSHIIAAIVAQMMKDNKNPVVFLPHAGDLAATPMTYLQGALALAFARDAKLLDQIARCDSVDQLICVVKCLPSFVLVVDQMNSLEESSSLDMGAKPRAIEIISNLQDTINCIVCVKGFSANNRTMILQEETQRSERDLVYFGGFTSEEYDAWLAHHQAAHAGHAADLHRDRDLIATQTGRVPMYLEQVMQSIPAMTLADALRVTTLKLSMRIGSDLSSFFDSPPDGLDRTTVLDVAACALEGSDPRRTRKYWDHRYIYADERGILRTVCFVVNDVLASILRDRSDKDGSEAILGEANILACNKCHNPTEQGCRAEEIAVTAISRGGCRLLGCMFENVVGEIQTHHFNTTDDVTLTDRFPAVHYVPRAFNYARIDSVLRVLTFGTGKAKANVVAADVYAFQYTRQTVAAHSGSLDFLTGDHEQWVIDLNKKISLRWHFVWVLTSTECSKQLQARPNIRGHGFLRPKKGGKPEFTEWFFGFSDIVPKLTLE